MPILNRLQNRKGTRLSTLLAALGGSALVGLACTVPALAEPATAEGARQLTAAFQAYIGSEPFEKGFLAIAPRGESYDLTFAFDSRKLALPDSDGSMQVDPYVVHLTPKTGGTWAVNTDPGPINLSWASTRDSLDEKYGLKFSDCVTQGVFDPSLMIFPNLSSKCGSAAFTARNPDADVDFTTGAITVASAGKTDGSGGVDLQYEVQLAGLNGKLMDKKSAGQPLPIAFKVGGISQALAASGVRVQAIADLVAFAKDNASREKLVAAQDELKVKLRAALPFWKDFSSALRLDDGVVDTPVGSAKIGHIEQKQALTGVVKDARYADALSYSGLELPPLIVPDWARTLIPGEASYDTKLSFSGLDGMADVLIRGLDASQEPPFTKMMAVALMTRFFSGQPQYELNLHAGAQAYTVKGEGKASINPEPQAGMSLSATGFDAVVSALSKAEDPDISKALFALAFAKGLAKGGADGQLVWNVSYDIVTNKVVVNDQSFSLPEPE
jgi:hypothetical protein